MGMKANIAIALDPSLMMVKAGMRPDPWQARVLRQRYRRLLLNCARQAGKSTVIACNALEEALYHAPSLTLILGPSERQSKELMRVVTRFREAMGVSVNPESQTTTSMEFLSGSRIVALPAKEQNIRGLAAVDLLIIDEASRVPDELYHAVRPMLAVSGGRVAALSTPFGKRGWWHQEWASGTDWERVRVTALEVSRISPEFLAEEKGALPDSWFRQEYMCEFADSDGAFFSYDDVQRALTDDVRPLFDLPHELGDAEVKPLFT
jgi:Terminase large subunit, T4likevirus-type, N-terminal